MATKNVADEEVDKAFKDLLDGLDTYGDLTTAQMRIVFQEYHSAVWAKGIQDLFQYSEPRIVPQKVTDSLFSNMKKIQNDGDANEVAQKLGSSLEKLRNISNDAFGELCAMLRASVTDHRPVASILSDIVLLDPENRQSAKKQLASKLMILIVTHCEALFGKIGAGSQFDPLGVRPRDYLVDQDLKSRGRLQTQSSMGSDTLNRATKGLKLQS
jgi:hypothetical protein